MYSLTALSYFLTGSLPSTQHSELKEKKKKNLSFNSSPRSFWQQGPVSWKTIFFMDQELRDIWGMIQVHYLYCEIYFYYDCISSTSGHLAFDSTSWGHLL